MAARIQRRRNGTAREIAEKFGVSPRTIQRDIAQPRAEWIEDQRQRRRAILEAYEADEATTWGDVGMLFNIDRDTARQLGARARRERAATERAKIEPPLPLEGLASQA
jgi:uncharacterized protein YjcR